uniref:3-oxo-5-alpha-steroid 4-dehydrogenase C-terminal domain-containing protein n=1 Tax=Esox lucius TaxID=8010 RepID=A0AAY5KH42_ESOLU
MLFLAGIIHLVCLGRTQAPYGRYLGVFYSTTMPRTVPARLAWFIQELPSLLVPVLMTTMTTSHRESNIGTLLLLGTFCLHYFQRTCVYSVMTRGRPLPLRVMVQGGMFCILNGFAQSHYLLHCACYNSTWTSDCSTLFLLGMAINIHSDYLLRNLRKQGEVVYKIPKGGLFEYVSGANYFGEIVEWLGYAIATWSMTGFSFAFCTLCFIGPRALHHHRYVRLSTFTGMSGSSPSQVRQGLYHHRYGRVSTFTGTAGSPPSQVRQGLHLHRYGRVSTITGTAGSPPSQVRQGLHLHRYGRVSTITGTSGSPPSQVRQGLHLHRYVRYTTITGTAGSPPSQVRQGLNLHRYVRVSTFTGMSGSPPSQVRQGLHLHRYVRVSPSQVRQDLHLHRYVRYTTITGTSGSPPSQVRQGLHLHRYGRVSTFTGRCSSSERFHIDVN